MLKLLQKNMELFEIIANDEKPITTLAWENDYQPVDLQACFEVWQNVAGSDNYFEFEKDLYYLYDRDWISFGDSVAAMLDNVYPYTLVMLLRQAFFKQLVPGNMEQYFNRFAKTCSPILITTAGCE